MKFRGMITDSTAMKDFMNIVTTISKLSRSAVVRITTQKLYFIVLDEDSGPRKPLVWCDLPNSYYFAQYNLVGVSDEHNEIFLEVSPVMLAKSLSLKFHVSSMKIKLTNKQSPCLTLEIDATSSDGLNRQLVHDIPVEVIARKQWSDYTEPTLQDFHVTLQLPSIKSVRNVVEHLRNMNHMLTVSANQSGRLTFRVENPLIKLSAHFPSLCVQSIMEGPLDTGKNADSDEEINSVDDSNREAVSCQIDIRKFLTLLNGMQITSHKTICSIVNEKMVRLHFEQPNVVTFQCFLTSVST